MFDSRIAKTLLVASAAAGLAFIAAPSPSKAAPRGYCAAYAQDVADDYAGHRGLVGSIVALPFDVTGAVLTGRTTYDARWEHAYNRAYADCRASGQHVAVVTSETHGFMVPSVDEDAQPGCNFYKYNRWDPARC